MEAVNSVTPESEGGVVGRFTARDTSDKAGSGDKHQVLRLLHRPRVQQGRASADLQVSAFACYQAGVCICSSELHHLHKNLILYLSSDAPCRLSWSSYLSDTFACINRSTHWNTCGFVPYRKSSSPHLSHTQRHALE